MTACVDCSRDLDHCHGVLVVHERGWPECTDVGCLDLQPARHGLVVLCAESGCTCGQ